MVEQAWDSHTSIWIVKDTGDSTDHNTYDNDGEDSLVNHSWNIALVSLQTIKIMAVCKLLPRTHCNNGYTSPNHLTFPQITPLQSSEDTSLPFESSQNINGRQATRRSRTGANVEGLSKAASFYKSARGLLVHCISPAAFWTRRFHLSFVKRLVYSELLSLNGCRILQDRLLYLDKDETYLDSWQQR